MTHPDYHGKNHFGRPYRAWFIDANNSLYCNRDGWWVFAMVHAGAFLRSLRSKITRNEARAILSFIQQTRDAEEKIAMEGKR